MSSIQDLESRLKSVEDRLKFVMTSMKLQVTGPTGLVGADGRPTIVTKTNSMEELYFQSLQERVN